MPAGRTTTRQPSGRRRAAAFGIVSLVALLIVTLPGAGLAEGQVSDRGHSVDRALDRALRALVAMPSAPPGVVAVVERGRSIGLHRAGIGDLRTGSPISGSDHMRLASASVSKLRRSAARLRWHWSLAASCRSRTWSAGC